MKRHIPWASLLALVAIILGGAMFGNSAAIGRGEAFARLAGLLVLLYGGILIWWRVAAATRPLQWRLARFARRIGVL